MIACNWHLNKNICKGISGILKGDRLESFKKAFYSCRNSLTTVEFYSQWRHLLESYPEAQNCLRSRNTKIEEDIPLWAQCYTMKAMTFGILGSQRAEGMNFSTKKHLKGADKNLKSAFNISTLAHHLLKMNENFFKVKGYTKIEKVVYYQRY